MRGFPLGETVHLNAKTTRGVTQPIARAVGVGDVRPPAKHHDAPRGRLQHSHLFPHRRGWSRHAAAALAITEPADGARAARPDVGDAGPGRPRTCHPRESTGPLAHPSARSMHRAVSPVPTVPPGHRRGYRAAGPGRRLGCTPSGDRTRRGSRRTTPHQAGHLQGRRRRDGKTDRRRTCDHPRCCCTSRASQPPLLTLHSAHVGVDAVSRYPDGHVPHAKSALVADCAICTELRVVHATPGKHGSSWQA